MAKPFTSAKMTICVAPAPIVSTDFGITLLNKAPEEGIFLNKVYTVPAKYPPVASMPKPVLVVLIRKIMPPEK